jgi:TonB family protein
MKHTLLALLMAATSPQTETTPAGTPLVDADGLRGWTAAQMKSDCVRNASGTLVIAECAGWLRTDSTVFGDYAIAFEVRARDAHTRALLGLLGVNDRNGRPDRFLAVPLLGPADERKSLPIGTQVLSPSASGREQAMKPAVEWQSYVVTRNRGGIHVLLNGTQILSRGPVHGSDGWIGFRAEGAGFELRDVHLRHLSPPSSSLPAIRAGSGALSNGTMVDGAYRPGNGVTLPKLVREVRPSYTREALAAKMEGTVTVECVVEADGTVGKATVIRSLDERFGLDQEAIKAARAWRFQPGTRNSMPVPVVITIELTFAIKK